MLFQKFELLCRLQYVNVCFFVLSYFSGSTVEYAQSGEKQVVQVTGIDEYGFLRVATANGKIISLQPDGNSFDILKGLIATKEK